MIRNTIKGNGYLFLMVIFFNYQYSTHNLNVPSFFFTNNMGAPLMDTLCQYTIYPSSPSISLLTFSALAYSFYSVISIKSRYLLMEYIFKFPQH